MCGGRVGIVWCVGQGWWNCVMCGEIWWNFADGVCHLLLNFEQLSNFQALLYISARTRGTSWLFNEAKIQVPDFSKVRVKNQGHFQVKIIINSGWTVEALQLQYTNLTSIRCVCVSRYSATDMWFNLYSKQLNTAYKLDRTGNVFGHHQAITKNIKQQSLNTAVRTA